MEVSLVSNPPFNMGWTPNGMENFDSRYMGVGVPPKGNANFVFVMSGLEMVTKKAVFIFSNNVLSTSDKNEKSILKYLIQENLVEAVIQCPSNMFEKTDIAVSILVFNKNKTTKGIEFIDLREYKLTKEKRKQKGQFGGKSHTNRVYEKEYNIISDELINEVIDFIENKKEIEGVCCNRDIQQVEENDYNLTPSRYIEFKKEEYKHRPYEDMYNELNRIIELKNECKLTCNITVAKTLGIDGIDILQNDGNETIKKMSETSEKLANIKLKENNYVTFTRSAEIKFENKGSKKISEIFLTIFTLWRQHLMFLNNQENILLAEIRDALLNDIFNDKDDVINKLGLSEEQLKP